MDLYWGCGQISHLAVPTHPIIHTISREKIALESSTLKSGILFKMVRIRRISQSSLYHRMMGRLVMEQDDSTSSDTNAAADGATGSSTSHPGNTECSPMDEETTSQTEDGLTGTLYFNKCDLHHQSTRQNQHHFSSRRNHQLMAPPQTVSLLRIAPQITVLIRKFLMISRAQPQMQAPVVLLW